MDATPCLPRMVFWEVTRGCNLRCIHCRATASELASALDLPTHEALNLIRQLSELSRPILVLSGGEPLFRSDLFELASYASDRGLRVALATNGTLITSKVAHRVVAANIRRVAISVDGADAPTHDAFRGIPGAFDAALRGFRALKELGVSLQINMTIARHNAHQLPQVLELARSLGAEALHTFLLVPVGCGVNIASEQMLAPDEYERILNWLYDRSMEGEIELKPTCAPHYFRIVRQRCAAGRRAAPTRGTAATFGPAQKEKPHRSQGTLRPQSWGGVVRRPGQAGPGGHDGDFHAMTKGCLAGSGVCFISHRGEVYPCGYLPVLAGDLKQQTFAAIWNQSPVFQLLRDPDMLKGKCGLCEFRNICMGCRARAFAATGDFLEEEPFCAYRPHGNGAGLQPDRDRGF